MRQFLIKIFLRLLTPSISREVIDEGKLEKFLWEIYPNKSFRDYIQKRDLEILQTIGSSVDREQYLILIGQRILLGRLLSDAKSAYDKIENQKNKINK